MAGARVALLSRHLILNDAACRGAVIAAFFRMRPGADSLETTMPEAASHGGRRPWKGA
jgi:hypothetical protein